ncbi:hypothetical protein NQ314_014806 [Rhamnusium bicolor]|uniref:DDE-1 domain-containing protein n=1 Tax=Rhamnusium bicolor TaxID=1586634 RepID=A0AAV8X038_9CUCU|nr:hypothetical protein NQ314_014806 [Rhamnusium bicolor]
MLIKKLDRDNPFTNGRPGRHWYQAFLKRNPELSQRVSQNLTRIRAGVTEENIQKWFDEITEHFKTIENLSDVVKNTKIVHNIINSSEKENITALIMANAADQMAPPMVVVNLKRLGKTLRESVPPSWAIGKSENGWMTNQTFYEYITGVFYPWLIESKIQFPIVLYLDGHVSHLTLPLSEFCMKKRIELVALYPNSTHFLQPMDVALFHPP